MLDTMPDSSKSMTVKETHNAMMEIMGSNLFKFSNRCRGASGQGRRLLKRSTGRSLQIWTPARTHMVAEALGSAAVLLHRVGQC
eukprot:6026576-Amphidinium_carterae.1